MREGTNCEFSNSDGVPQDAMPVQCPRCGARRAPRRGVFPSHKPLDGAPVERDHYELLGDSWEIVRKQVSDKRKIWQVQEISGKGWGRTVMSGQTRYVAAHTRKEAEGIYEQKYKKYKSTTMSAIVISHDMREWSGDPV